METALREDATWKNTQNNVTLQTGRPTKCERTQKKEERNLETKEILA